jgi:hypothetical protein
VIEIEASPEELRMVGDTINAHHERQFLFRDEKQSNHDARDDFL